LEIESQWDAVSIPHVKWDFLVYNFFCGCDFWKKRYYRKYNRAIDLVQEDVA
jgi:hypothetical protein